MPNWQLWERGCTSYHSQLKLRLLLEWNNSLETIHSEGLKMAVVRKQQLYINHGVHLQWVGSH